MTRRSNKTRRLPDVRQASLLTVEKTPTQRSAVQVVQFDRGDRQNLFIGAVPLDTYLDRGGLKWVLRFAELLDDVDWSDFEASYKPGGRPALHPQMVVGIIMYGLILKQPSLRQLESLALRDVGAWWLSGGLTPDHTTFTKFIQRHARLLSEDFFVQVTRRVVKGLGVSAGDLGLDGTVAEAMASTAQALKREALEKELKDAKESIDPERVEQLEAAGVALTEREAAKKAAGKDPKTALVSPVEPEAVLQPQKNSEDFRLSYKPVVGVHASGVIVGQALSPSSETACVTEVLTQHGQILDAVAETTLADSGFNTLEVLTLMLALSANALIPSGRSDNEGMNRKGTKGRFPKSAFVYDETTDTVLCPAGAVMRPRKAQPDRAGRMYREFRTPACASCPLRERCKQPNAKARRLKRYVGEEMKDVMAQVLHQRAAREHYAKRSVIAEPAFARLREQGLGRFRRAGVKGARLEFALLCTAHNLRLLLFARKGVVIVIATVRVPNAPWRVAAVAIVKGRE